MVGEMASVRTSYVFVFSSVVASIGNRAAIFIMRVGCVSVEERKKKKKELITKRERCTHADTRNTDAGSSPRCGLSYGVRTAPVCNRMLYHLCAR